MATGVHSASRQRTDESLDEKKGNKDRSFQRRCSSLLCNSTLSSILRSSWRISKERPVRDDQEIHNANVVTPILDSYDCVYYRGDCVTACPKAPPVSSSISTRGTLPRSYGNSLAFRTLGRADANSKISSGVDGCVSERKVRVSSLVSAPPGSDVVSREVEVSASQASREPKEDEPGDDFVTFQNCRRIHDVLLQGTYDSPEMRPKLPEDLTLEDLVRQCMLLLPPENEADSEQLQAKLAKFSCNSEGPFNPGGKPWIDYGIDVSGLRCKPRRFENVWTPSARRSCKPGHKSR